MRFAHSRSRNASAPGPEHLELRERRLVEERDRFARRARLHLDRGRPVLARPAARAQRLVAGGGVRLVPVDALPAALLAEGGAERRMTRIRRRHAQRPPRLPLLARVLDVVVLRQRLVRARERVCAAAVLPSEAAPVERPHVPLGTAVDDPLAHHLADAARAREPVRAPAGGDPEAGHVRLAEQEVGVGRERLGAVEEHLHLGALHRWHAVDRVREQLLHPLPFLREQLRLEPVGDAVERPRRGLALVAAHDEPADLGAEVDEVVRVAQCRQRLERRVERLGDEVLVAERDRSARRRRRAPQPAARTCRPRRRRPRTRCVPCRSRPRTRGLRASRSP